MTAAAAETATPEAIVRTMYQLLSGGAGKTRDWDRWRSLHHPAARSIPIERSPDGTVFANAMTTDEYIASRTPFLLANDFHEWEIDRAESRHGRMAHVWSTYVAALAPGGKPIRRGVNSIQMWHDGSRWWILSVTWDAVAAMDASV